MELERLEVIVELNTQKIEDSMARFMPKIKGLMDRMEGVTGRSSKQVEEDLDMSKAAKTIDKTMGEAVDNFTKQMERMEKSAKDSSTATSRQMETGFKNTRAKANKEIDLMVKDISSKLGQAKAAQGRIAELTARRTAATKEGDTGKVVNYDTQIARATDQMNSYRSKAITMARAIKSEFDAVPASLNRIAETMDMNEGRIETMRSKIKSLQEQYNKQLSTTGNFQTGFKQSDNDTSLGTMQKIQKESAAMHKLVLSNDQLQNAYATTEDRSKSLKQALDVLNNSLGKSTIQSGNASMSMDTVAQRSNKAKDIWSKFGGLFNRTTNNIAHGARRSGMIMGGFFSLFNRGANNISKRTNSMSRSTGMFGKTISRLATRIFVYGLLYRGVVALSKGLLSSLKTNEQFASSLNQIKVNLLTAFYPIYQAVLPAINALMNALARLSGYMASFVANLFGTTYSAAKKGAQGLYENVKALDETGNGATKAKDKVKDLQNSLMGFDEINRIGLDVGTDDEENKKGVNFDTPDYSTPKWLTDFAKNASDILSRLFQPMQAAWDQYGQGVLDSMKYAMKEIWELSKSVGRSFLEAWTGGTGELILGNILQLITSIFNSVGNLASQFRIAWETNNLGVSIFSTILGIVADLTGHIRDMGKATEEWSRNLDFTPLLTSVDKLLKAVRPLTDNIGAGLSWFYENVLLPIAKWTIEDVLPAFLDVLSGALEILDGVIEAMKPTFQWLWDEMLKPIAEWSGGAIVSILEELASALSKIGDWIGENQTAFANFVTAFVVFGGTIKIIKGIKGILALESVVAFLGTIKTLNGAALVGGLGGALKGVVAFLAGPWGIAIGLAVTAGVLLWKNWDTVKEKAGQLKDWVSDKWTNIKDKTSETWTNVKDKIKTESEESRKRASENVETLRRNASTAWDGIKKKTSDTWSNFSTTVRDKAENARKWGSDKITNLKNSASTKWNELKTDTATKWGQISTDVSSKAGTARANAVNAFSRMKTGVGGYLSEIKTSTSTAFDKVTGWASGLGTKIADGLRGGLQSVKNAAASIANGIVGTIGKAVNGVISGINWVLGKVGAGNSKIATWSVPTYAQGTGNHPGGPAIVNDASGSNYQEAYEVNGKVGLFPKVRNMLVDLPKGAKVLDGNRTARMYGDGIPQYANGIGNWLGKAWNGAKQMAGTVWDYVSNPSKLLDIAISKFVNLSGALDPALSIAKGGIGTIAKEATNFVKGFLHQGPEESGNGRVNFNGLVRTSGYGYRTHPIRGTRHLHAGVDYGGGMGIGHPIHAQASGTVRSAGPAGGGYGNWVNVKNGVYDYIYAHLSKALVGRGAAVNTGQKIGLMGNTGNSTGPHVHYEVRRNGSPIDPDAYHATMSKSETPVGQGVERWRSTVVRALSMNGLPTSEAYVNAWLRQIKTESGGNEKAIQSSGVKDVNYYTGNLARGLVQVIPPTFNAYAFPGHNNPFNGLHSLLAGMNYAKNRYGRTGMLNAVGRGIGYENGGLVSNEGYYRLAEGNKKEMVIPLERKGRALELIDMAKSYLGVDDFSTTLSMPDSVIDKPSKFTTSNTSRDVGGGVNSMTTQLANLLAGMSKAQSSNDRPIEVTMQVDRDKLGQIVIKSINERIDRTGDNPLNI
ncbi:peptidoglycan DD-metalloendopeptidase family protein [Jeotgalibaca porci]|uniref:peptidoglycan DD-metalloendopeptidase family protein n=1 Tax=Jeotgalibaca porci TaxID=1868793 RepID=UPI0035A1368B